MHRLPRASRFAAQQPIEAGTAAGPCMRSGRAPIAANAPSGTHKPPLARQEPRDTGQLGSSDTVEVRERTTHHEFPMVLWPFSSASRRYCAALNFGGLSALDSQPQVSSVMQCCPTCRAERRARICVTAVILLRFTGTTHRE